MEESKIWERRHGGDLISLYPYIVNAKYSLDKRMGKMQEYWQHALAAAERFNRIAGIKTVPEIPVCNMFHVYFNASKDTLEKIFITVTKKSDLAVISYFREINSNCCMTELSFGDSYSLIPQEVLDTAFEELELEFKNL